MTAQLSPKEIERFWSKVRRGDGCWLWTGEVNNKGYGRFTVWSGNARRRLLTHRLAYELTHGLLGAQKARHRCDNPPCCNPDHIEPGTQRDNIQDAVRRGRWNRSGLDEYRRQRDEGAVVRLAAGDLQVASRIRALKVIGLRMPVAARIAHGDETARLAVIAALTDGWLEESA